MSVGPYSPPEGEESLDPVRLVWPITKLAASPVENGGLYSRTRLLLVSTTQMSPLESKATAVGLPMEVALGGLPAARVVRSGWPITMHMLRVPMVEVTRHGSDAAAAAMQRYEGAVRLVPEGHVGMDWHALPLSLYVPASHR